MISAPERRRQLRQERRRERLKHLWRIAVFSGGAAGLGWLLLQQGWVLRSAAQIEVIGSKQIDAARVIQEGELKLPQPLLTLHPQALTERLYEGLPVEQVQVSRLMLPPRLRITLVEREAVAKAQRRTNRGVEQGYVDRFGHWMTTRQQRGSGPTRLPSVKVLGWQERLRRPLAAVLAQQDQLGSTLLQVRFEPDGNLWLRTAALGDVHLGPADEQLEQRLAMLRHLSGHLPSQIKDLKIQSIDLSDPNQPELGLPPKAKPKASAKPKQATAAPATTPAAQAASTTAD